jgi:diacylglycerol kinase family enzyme
MKIKPRVKRLRVVLNGKVAGNDLLRAAIARQRAAGHRIEVRVTREKGDARRFVSEAGKVDLVVAAGGEGTLNEVLHGLMSLSAVTRPILGIVPLGTANDFAIGCDIPRDPAKALALCI